jgi:hypothetical protein
MIIEYSVEDLRNYYNDNFDINYEYEELETVLSDKIDEKIVNSDILHFFPILLSSTLTLIATTYFFI